MRLPAGNRLVPLLVAAALALGGCASPANDEADQSEGALTAGEVVPEGSVALLTNQTPGADAKAKLGIARWDLFLVNNTAQGLDGVVAYASDRDGQVAFAVVATTTGASADKITMAAIRYDLDGIAKDQAFDTDTRTLLDGELASLARATSRAAAASASDAHPAGLNDAIKRSPAAGGCALGVGAVMLGAVVLLGPTFVLSEFVAPAIPTVQLALAMSVGNAALTGTELALVGWVYWDKTKLVLKSTAGACKAAASGR